MGNSDMELSGYRIRISIVLVCKVLRDNETLDADWAAVPQRHITDPLQASEKIQFSNMLDNLVRAGARQHRKRWR